MSTVKDEAKTLIDELSDDDVEILMQMARRLAEWKATQEILDSPEMMQEIEEGLSDLREGRTINWRDLP